MSPHSSLASSRRLWRLVEALDSPTLPHCRVALHRMVAQIDSLERQECEGKVYWLPEESQWLEGALCLCTEWLQDLAVGGDYGG